MKNGEGKQHRGPKQERARRREQGEPGPAAAQEPSGQAARGAPERARTLSAIAFHVDNACADMTTAKWRARDGDFARATELIRRARRELVEADIVASEMNRAVARTAAGRRGRG
jgi:hypothetical protein